MTNKRMFLPLRAVYFSAFLSGAKNTEYRLYGARWNERVCPVGRGVTISRGYSGPRAHGRIREFRVLRAADVPGVRAVYPFASDDTRIAAITIDLLGATPTP